MLKIDKLNCCGCGACVQICPKHCIQMEQDDEGFMYPSINETLCINCNLCDKVCPINFNEYSKVYKPIKAFAFQHKDYDILKKSSSGGAFSSIALEILKLHGIVFGAAFNKKWMVEHVSIINSDELKYLQGSKYVQSDIKSTYKEAEKQLKEGKVVLYSGTPCQIEGLYSFLRKEYINLYTINLSCHGVPSPKIWKNYLDENTNGIDKVEKIEFRNKRNSWRKYRIVIKSNKTINNIHYDDPYFLGFLYNIYLRPSCYNCIYKKNMFKADFTLADCWHIDKKALFDINKGVSLVLVNTNKGFELIKKIIPFSIINEVSIEDALNSNNGLKQYTDKPLIRDKFFTLIQHNGLSQTIIKILIPSFSRRIVFKIKKYIHNVIS